METTYYPQEKIIEKKNDLKKGLSLSFFFHIFVVTFIILEARFFTSEPIDFSSAVRVDLVGLPDKIEPQASVAEPEAKTVEEKPVEKPQEKPEEKKALPDKKLEIKKEPDAISFDKKDIKKQQSALDKIKSMQAIDKIKNEVAKSPAAPTKGSVISPGSSLSGLNKIQHGEFISQIDRHIKNNWSLPQWLTNKNYRAQVLVKFDENGMLTSKQLVRSSGNPAYDEVALSTIDKSSPFPKPPEKFSAILKYDGILVGFPE